MTTVIYSNGNFYSDSRSTATSSGGDLLYTYGGTQKVKRVSGCVVATSGNVKDCDKFIHRLSKGETNGYFTENNFEAIVYTKSEKLFLVQAKQVEIFSLYRKLNNFWEKINNFAFRQKNEIIGFLIMYVIVLCRFVLSVTELTSYIVDLLHFRYKFGLWNWKMYGYYVPKNHDIYKHNAVICIGSGCKYVNEAWAMGWDPKNCVRYAASKDPFTNYDIREFSVDNILNDSVDMDDIYENTYY